MQMHYREITSPLGKILLQCNDHAITGLWLDRELSGDANSEELLLLRAQAWLDAYFRGENPTLDLPLEPEGTDFQKEVWQILLTIPYGGSMTYGEIAARLGRRMSAQAVGGAVGRNPIALMIPCHRVLGAKGALTGFGYGLERKKQLLNLEKIPYRE